MGDQTKGGIAWTDQTWNPVRGCTRVSEGCRNCYAEVMAARFSDPGQPYHLLAKRTPSGPRWTGEVSFIAEHLEDPIRWKRPRRVFVNSMSDLFHEGLHFEEIAAIFGVMATARRHQFQVLTKRPARMREWFKWMGSLPVARMGRPEESLFEALTMASGNSYPTIDTGWPLPNIWLGVSVEDQATADERIPELLATPAAVRWVSYEPALGPVDFKQCLGQVGDLGAWTGFGARIDWIVVGGESGPGARPFDLRWARSVISQCKAAGVACFVKQMGRVTVCQPADRSEEGGGETHEVFTKDQMKNPRLWDQDLRVRQFPDVTPSVCRPTQNVSEPTQNVGDQTLPVSRTAACSPDLQSPSKPESPAPRGSPPA